MIVRQMNMSDIHETAKMMVVAFSVYGDPVNDANLNTRIINLTDTLKLNLGTPFVAEIDNKIIGGGILRYYDDVVWISSMTTHPDYQRRGVGSSILEKLLELAKNKGFDSVELYGSEMGESIYSRYGFKSMNYRACSYQIANVISIDIEYEPKVIDNLPEWIELLDKRAHGTNRGVYLSYLNEKDAQIIGIENEGYCFIRGNRIGSIVAKTWKIAVKLIEYVFANGIREIIFPSHKEINPNFLRHVIMEKSKLDNNLKMILGKPKPRDLKLIYAVDSYGTG